MLKTKKKKEATDIFEVMEKRLFFYIMRPAMIFTWVFGLVLIYLKWNRNFFSIMVSNKDCLGNFTISL